MSKLKTGHRADLRALWPHAHCVPIAIATLAGLDPEQALRLAHAARRTPADDATRAFGLLHKAMLLNAHGGGLTGTREYRAQWFTLAGLREITSVRYSRLDRRRDRGPTLAQFARLHPRGKFLVLVRHFRHAIAVIDGRVFWGGWLERSHARTRVNRWVQVEAV